MNVKKIEKVKIKKVKNKKKILKAAGISSIIALSLLGYNSYKNKLKQQVKEEQVNLKQVNEEQVNLKQVNLKQVNLKQVNLKQVNRKQVNEEQVKYKEKQIRYRSFIKQIKTIETIEKDINFLACDFKKQFGNKSNLDVLNIDDLLEILKYFTNLSQINKVCLQSDKIKQICCNNRHYIFSKILNYIGYTKKITKNNSETIFKWIYYPCIKSNTIKFGDFYMNIKITNGNVYDYEITAKIILATINNKITLEQLEDHYTKNSTVFEFNILIYYYTSNLSIKKYLLDKYNTSTRLQQFENFKLDNSSKLILEYFLKYINNKIGSLTHNDIQEFCNFTIKNLKSFNYVKNPYIDY